MKNQTFFLFILTALFSFSCQDDKDPIIPEGYKSGFFEAERSSLSSDQLNVEQYVFKPNGEFESYSIIRDESTKDILGYTSFSKGTYVFTEEFFQYTILEFSGIDIENSQDNYVPNLSDLVLYDKLLSRELKSKLEKSDSESFTLSYPCEGFHLDDCRDLILYTRTN